MNLGEEPVTRGPISIATGTAVKKVENELIAAIAACENDVRRGLDDLTRLKEALRSLRRQKQLPHPNTQRKRSERAVRPARAETSTSVRQREGSAASIIRSFVTRELRRAGHPLTRAEILERLNHAGIKIEAKVPIKRIAKVMWSSEAFVHVGDGYWFAGEPIPESQDKVSS
jgi:hypothetical protein